MLKIEEIRETKKGQPYAIYTLDGHRGCTFLPKARAASEWTAQPWVMASLTRTERAEVKMTAEEWDMSHKGSGFEGMVAGKRCKITTDHTGYLARITGPDRKYGMARDFLSKRGQRSVTHVGPGLYEVRGGRTTVYLLVDGQGATEEMTKEEAQAFARHIQPKRTKKACPSIYGSHLLGREGTWVPKSSL